MRKVSMARVLALGLASLAAACSVSYSKTDVVDIPAGESDEHRLTTAELIGRELWNGSLKPYILQAVPEVSAAELDAGLGLRWGNLTKQDPTDSAKSVTRVYLQCSYESTQQDERLAKVVAACKQHVSEAVSKRYEGAAPA